MKKIVNFNEKDAVLVNKIAAYQKNNNIPSFIEAVRILCSNALDMSEAIKKFK